MLHRCVETAHTNTMKAGDEKPNRRATHIESLKGKKIQTKVFKNEPVSFNPSTENY